MASERGRTGQPSRAGIVDVARHAGVSVATVSRALRGMPNVSQATRSRVLRSAAELQYTASPLASGLVTGRVRSVGVVLPYASQWFFAEVIGGIEEALRDQGYDLVLHVLADERRRQDFFDSLPVRRRVDALLVVGLPLDERESEILRGLGIPLACVAEPVPGLHSELVDNVAAGRTAVQHLLNLGHRRIACIGGDMTGPERYNLPGLRTRGYRQALDRAGIDPRSEWERNGDFTPQGGESAMTSLLSSVDPPTAVFCQSDEMAFGAFRALRRSGLRYPQDISVVGVDGHELAEVFDLTTVAQPVAAQGAAAARWLIDRLDGHSRPEETDRPPEDDRPPGTDRPPEDVSLHPIRLVLRGSTAPAPDHR